VLQIWYLQNLETHAFACSVNYDFVSTMQLNISFPNFKYYRKNFRQIQLYVALVIICTDQMSWYPNTRHFTAQNYSLKNKHT